MISFNKDKIGYFQAKKIYVKLLPDIIQVKQKLDKSGNNS